MATPKGMRAVPLPVSETDAVHVYSDEQHIWIQLRRAVPTERDIGNPSFKIAFCLTATTAQKLGSELLKLAERNRGQKDERARQEPAQAKTQQPPPKAKSPTSKPRTNDVKPIPHVSNTKALEEGVPPCPRCRKTKTIEHAGRQWCPHCGAFTTGRNTYSLPPTITPASVKKPKVVDLIPNRRNAQEMQRTAPGR